LIRNGAVADVISELEISNSVYSKINGHTYELQNDINESAYIFADTAVLDRLFITAYPFPNDVSINLNDIPLNARVTKIYPGIQTFVSKLKKYNFYLATRIRVDYVRILNSFKSAVSVLRKEYHLK
jgi:hypothetical protein